MHPVLAMVGRPNVGKSTLFNRLTHSRDALVADFPGLTRDRKYGLAEFEGQTYTVIDTGGLMDDAAGVDALTAKQAWHAVAEADAVLFLVDGRSGPSAADEEIAARLRGNGKPVWLIVNKAEGQASELITAEFYALGLGEPLAISAAHGQRIHVMLENILTALGVDFEAIAQAAAEAAQAEEEAVFFAEEEVSDEDASVDFDEEDEFGEDVDRPEHEFIPEGPIAVAVLGRPNVGKSTLVNRLLGEERVVASDLPGTTRDTIEIPFSQDGHDYRLIDTAGVRRRARVQDAIEKFSVIKALEAMQQANVIIYVIDAREGVTDQDANLLGHVVQSGRALVLALNKWDGMETDAREWVQQQFDRRLPYLDYASVHRISALHGSGIRDLMGSVQRAWRSASLRVATPMVNRILEDAVRAHPPPAIQGRRIKLRYAHQGGHNPPRFIVHGNQTQYLPESYRRYLSNQFRKALGLEGTPVRLDFRTGDNPFAGRRNTLTPRQEHKRKRMIKHLKKGK
jgi:GTP-binding protein